MNEWPADHVERWPLLRLIPYARNARTHSPDQIKQIAASMREWGWTIPVLADEAGMIIAGHARVQAAELNGYEEVPVMIARGWSEAKKRAYVLADNKLAMNAGWDEEMLRLELEDLRLENFDLDILGFGAEELSDLFYRGDDAPDADVAPEPQERVISRPGDLWLLGQHRLLCGDATQRSDVEQLMAHEKADLLFSDCPYNVDYEGYTEDRLKIQGDRMNAEQFRTFLAQAFGSYQAIAKKTASLYVCHGSSWQREFQSALEGAGFEIRCQIIWAKNQHAWGFGRYKFQHEPIFYCHLAGESDAWYGDKTQSTLWVENKPAANRMHPTMKPVELIERALVNSSRKGDLVADLFGGSGSTLIASERIRRVACLMEIDPRYCDVIVRRWQDYTRQEATAASGESFEAVAAERANGNAAAQKDELWLKRLGEQDQIHEEALSRKAELGET